VHTLNFLTLSRKTNQCRTKEIILTRAVKRSFTPSLNTTETKEKMALYRQRNGRVVGVLSCNLGTKTTTRLVKLNVTKVNRGKGMTRPKDEINRYNFTRSISSTYKINHRTKINHCTRSTIVHDQFFKIKSTRKFTKDHSRYDQPRPS
jgi:hypothetical protein